MEAPRQKRKYEKKKVLPLSSGIPHYSGPAVFNAKDLNQYDFPSSDDEPFSQVQELYRHRLCQMFVHCGLKSKLSTLIVTMTTATQACFVSLKQLSEDGTVSSPGFIH